MAVHSPSTAAPQFVVSASGSNGLGIGSKVSFNGQEVQNVCRIEVESAIAVDDVVRSRLTIELVGEAILVEALPA